MKYSIIIPCYNEEENIPGLIKELVEYNVNREIEYVLVENGSKDNSWTLLREQTKCHDFFTLVKVDVNIGYGFGIAQGVKAASGEYIGWLHADLQVGLHELDNFFDYIQSNNYPQHVMLKGRRFNRSIVEYFFTNAQALFETVLFRTILFDISAIPVLFDASLKNELTDMPNGFEVELYVYYKAKKAGYMIPRFPIRMVSRKGGKSSWNTGFISRIRQSFRIIIASYNIKK